MTPKNQIKTRDAFHHKSVYADNYASLVDETIVPFYKQAVDKYFRPSLLDMNLWERRAVFHRGLSCYKRKEWDNAISWFQSAITQYPYLNDYAMFFMAECLEKKGDLKGAGYLLNEIIKDCPGRPLIPEVNLKLADIYLCQKEYARAIETYERCLRILPTKNDYILYKIGLAKLETDTESSIESFKTLIVNEPDSDFSRLARENINQLYPPDGANRLLKLSQDQKLRMTERLFQKNRYKSAIELYLHLIDNYTDPIRQCHARHRLAQCYDRTGQRELAIKELEYIVENAPEMDCMARARFLLARMLWNKHRNKEAEGHFKYILENCPSCEMNEEILYLLGRIAEEEGEFTKAVNYYEKIENGYVEGPFYWTAIWRIGWIYYIAGYHSYAASHFGAYWFMIRDQALQHKFLYWKGRAEEKTGNQKEAKESYETILDSQYFSFYTGLSAETLMNLRFTNGNENTRIRHSGEGRNPGFTNERTGDVTGIRHTYIEALRNETGQQEDFFLLLNEKEKAIVDRIWELWLLGMKDESAKEIQHHIQLKNGSTPQLLYCLSLLAHTNYTHYLGIRIGILYKKAISSYNIDTYGQGEALIYPMGYWPIVLEKAKQNQLDPVLVLSLIRQESLFDPFAISSSSAYGLMQIIPSTARLIAKDLEMDAPADMRSLYDPDLNLTMGCYYLRKVLDEFDQNMVYALAAYNAGPGAVKRWKKNFADLDIDEFIESIPYNETREYVRRVMKNYWIYKNLTAESF
ncbi:transglycosylase SLT domain-containing protein [bacterium]|nr:transglycosylase SLT domain-containing protein [bacterium]